MSEITVTRADILSAAAQALIAALNAELAAQYPEPGATHFRVDADEVRPGSGMFVIAWRRETAVGCGALRRIEPGVGELKRMFVVPRERGSGIGRAVLYALETEAARLGMRRLVLETGVRQAAAIALYQNAGFVQIAPYGEYTASPDTSVCMAKEIAAKSPNESISSQPL